MNREERLNRRRNLNQTPAQEASEDSGSRLPSGERSFERFVEMMINSMNRQEAPTSNWLKVYRDMRSPSFKGDLEADPSVGEYWLEQTEKLLEHLECPIEHWVRCATFMLEEEAGIWWKSMAGILRTRNVIIEKDEMHVIPITWEQFRIAFNDKYFPEYW